MKTAGLRVEAFVERGYLGPIPIFSSEECHDFLVAIESEAPSDPTDWEKSRAVVSRPFYEMATHPAVVEVVASLLGDDVMLWGASLVHRTPRAVHPWHTDVESADASGRTVAVWVGLENTCRNSSLLLASYSHRFGLSVQEARHRFGKRRDETTDDDVVRWARDLDDRSRLSTPELGDGDALFFDGRLWHGSSNLSALPRKALLLQYASSDTRIRIPDLTSLDWPFRLLDEPRPACLMVRGVAKSGVNRIVEPAPAGGAAPTALACRIDPLRIPLEPDPSAPWKPYRLAAGATPNLRALNYHASVLMPGQCPHPPHRHREEELILMLAGEVELTLPDLPRGNQSVFLESGQFAFYPAHFAHTLRTVSAEPANYVVFKWHNRGSGGRSPMPFASFDLGDRASENEPGFQVRMLFEGPTDCLERLHCHVSTLTPGAGYEPHVDEHDVAIVVLEGEVETLGRRVRPHGVIFYPADLPHGISNPGDSLARYVVFEFHGPRAAAASRVESSPRSIGAPRSAVHRSRIVAVSMVKNEIDIIEAFVRHAVALADRLVVLDHGSSDGTLDVLHALRREGLPIDVLEDKTLGKHHGRRITSLMREHAVGRHGADWVWPLDADEFPIVDVEGLADELAGARQPLDLAWRTYVPDGRDDPSERNPVLRITRRRSEEPRRWAKVLVPGELAVLPEARVAEGNHGVSISDVPCVARPAAHARLAHFPVRSPGQYLAKIGVGYLNRLVAPDRQNDWGFHYREPFARLKIDPAGAAAGFHEAARRYALPSDVPDNVPTVHDPIEYRGGPLRHTPAIDDPWRAVQALASFAEDLAKGYAGLADGLDGLLEEDGASLCGDTAPAADADAQVGDGDPIAQQERDELRRCRRRSLELEREKRVLLRDRQSLLDLERRWRAVSESSEQNLRASENETQARELEIHTLRASRAWRLGNAIIGPLRPLKLWYLRVKGKSGPAGQA